MISIFLRRRVNWVVAAGCTILAIYYAHSQGTWIGQVSSTLQAASTASVLFYPFMTTVLAFQSSQLFSRGLRYLERDRRLAARARLVAFLGWLVPYLVGYAVLCAATLVTTALYGPLSGGNLAVAAVGPSSMVMWAAIAVAVGAALPRVIGIPILMVTSFLVPLYAGSLADTIPSVFTPVASIGFPPMFTIQTPVVTGQALWSLAMAVLVLVLFCHRGVPRSRAGIVTGVASALAVTGLGVLLVLSGGVRSVERSIPLTEASCQRDGAFQVCLYPENADLVERVLARLAVMGEGAPPGAFPATLAEPGITGADATVVLPNRVAVDNPSITESLLSTISQWQVCETWLQQHPDDTFDRMEWLWRRAGEASSGASVSSALEAVLAGTESEQWQWWLEPITQCAG